MEIRNYKPINKGVLLARFDLAIPKWGNYIIHGMSWCRKDQTGEWISFPTYTLDTPEGKKYLAHCRFEERETHKAMEKQVLPQLHKIAEASKQEPAECQDDLPF